MLQGHDKAKSDYKNRSEDYNKRRFLYITVRLTGIL
jgi:hypothetical protein